MINILPSKGKNIQRFFSLASSRCDLGHCFRHCTRGAVHPLEKAYEIFLEQRNLFGFLMDFSRKKGFLPKVYEIFGSEKPLNYT